MIPDLAAGGESPGMEAGFVPLALAGVFTLFVMLVQSIVRLFDDRKSQSSSVPNKGEYR